ncbi:MAG: YeeE/YedE thiosulfate transporter family protein [Balneolales bacterium]
MLELLYQPWSWYIAGPVIGLMVPLLLYIGNKSFGVSSNFRHICAACDPAGIEYFSYDWRTGLWNLVLIMGVAIGGFLGGWIFVNPEPIAIAAQTTQDLKALGVSDFSGFVPSDIFNWETMASTTGFIVLVIGGFLVGFGTRYAGGCTSGHAISGLSNLQLASLIAVVGFFIGGLFMTYVLLPLIL